MLRCRMWPRNLGRDQQETRDNERELQLSVHACPLLCSPSPAEEVAIKVDSV